MLQSPSLKRIAPFNKIKSFFSKKKNAGDVNAEVTEEEVTVVRMKTRQMAREEMNQSMVTAQQGNVNKNTETRLPLIVALISSSLWVFHAPSCKRATPKSNTPIDYTLPSTFV